MASSQLLDINVDTLFEQHSISEIDQIHKRLQMNVEEKREELRMMVGERYRDLLQAADTIGDMKQTSTSVIQHVDGIMASCRRLNDQQLIGFKLTPSAPFSGGETSLSAKFDKSIKNYYGIVAQIRLLTVLPELIWSRLDTEDFFVATQLFIFSRHISTGLQLDANSGLMKKFSVAKRQWNILNQFFFTIKNLCLDTLERPELEAETAAKCLASLLLLENCQMDRLLTLFTQLRSKAFRKVVKSGSETHRRSQQIKDKILAGLHLLNETVTLLSKCFIDADNESSYLVKELEKITGKDSKPTISYIEMDDSALTGTLPPMITKFKPHIQVKPLQPDTIQSTLKVWLQVTEKDSKEYLKALVDDVGSVRTIHGIKTSALELKTPSDWKLTLQKLLLPSNIDFYQLYCQPLIRNRIKEIIETSWENTVDKTQVEISDLLENSESIWTTDRKPFWSEDTADIPVSLKQALSSDKQSHKLLMKTKGFSPAIGQICNLLDTNIETLYKDLSLYLSAGISDQISNKCDEDEKKDHEKVIEFLRDCSREGVTRLITSIKSIKSEKFTQENIIFLARLLKAITEICPNLKLCLTQTLLPSSSWDDSKVSDKSPSVSYLEHWDRICRLLEEEAISLWKHWLDLFVADLLKEHNGHCFATKIDLISLLNIFPNWDTITIEEKDDQNQPIESTIRIPSQPSVPLQDFLFKCCERLNQTIPNTLPKAVTTLLAERLVDKVQITYGELLTANDFIANNQNISLQFYFDLKFLNMMFVGGRRTVASIEKENRDDLSTLANRFKAHIDPFDFELFHKHINANVKRGTQRMQHQYGLLIPNFDHLAVTSTTQVSSLQDKEPNVLALSVSGTLTNLFPLLPIIIPSAVTASTASPAKVEMRSSGKTEKTKSKKSPQKSAPAQNPSTSSSSAQQNLANVKSNAAAFFGAMSPQDWFR